MKRLGLFLCLFSCTASTWANTSAAKGAYIGGDLTLSAYEEPRGAAFHHAIIPVAGHIRPFLGYRFNDYFALEGGFNNLVDERSNGGRATVGFFGEPEITGPDHYRLYAFDFATKWIYPLQNDVSVYGKIGFAYVHQDVYNKMFMDSQPSVDTNSDRILPLVGIGTSYNFTKNIAGELFVTYLSGVSPIGSITMTGLGVSYAFD